MTERGRPDRANARIATAASMRLPEIVGGVVSGVVVVVLLTGGLLGSSATPSPTAATSGPPVSFGPSAPPASLVDATLVRLLVTVNDQLAINGARLAALIAGPTISPADVAATVRELNSTVRSAIELLPQLERQPGAGQMAATLREFYDNLGTRATAGLQASVTNAAAYRQTAADLIAILETLPTLQAGLQALLLLPPASFEPTPSLAATPSPESSATSTPDGSGGPSASATILPGGPELIVNGSFDPTKAPWALDLDPGASATFVLDLARFNTAPSAAQITIDTPTTSRGAIALRQSGTSITAGATYVLRVALAASEPREVSLRVASADGVTYGSRIVVATPGWAIFELQFGAPIGDPAAVVSIELGRSTATTWIDDVSLREAP